MRVGELIEKLQQVHPNTLVCAIDSAWGMEKVEDLYLVRVRKISETSDLVHPVYEDEDYGESAMQL